MPTASSIVRLGRALRLLPLIAVVVIGCTPKIRLAFVVNQDHYAIDESDLEQTALYASESLEAATGKTYVYQGATFGAFASTDPHVILAEFVAAHAADPADYVVIFTKHPQSVSAGGFMLDAYGRQVDELEVQLVTMGDYCNPAGSVLLPPGVVYGAVLDWHHLIGACGYQLNGLDYVHVQDTSFGGQCRNQSGLVCEFAFGEWQCPNLLADPKVLPHLEDRRRFTAQTINHELLHNFGSRGNMDHQCAAGTSAEILARSAFEMCGSTVLALEAAGPRCVLDDRPMGTICTHGSQCGDAYCYEFGLPIEYQCSHTCANVSACDAVPGKKAFCRIRRTDIPTTDNSCFYQSAP